MFHPHCFLRQTTKLLFFIFSFFSLTNAYATIDCNSYSSGDGGHSGVVNPVIQACEEFKTRYTTAPYASDFLDEFTSVSTVDDKEELINLLPTASNKLIMINGNIDNLTRRIIMSGRIALKGVTGNETIALSATSDGAHENYISSLLYVTTSNPVIIDNLRWDTRSSSFTLMTSTPFRAIEINNPLQQVIIRDNHFQHTGLLNKPQDFIKIYPRETSSGIYIGDNTLDTHRIVDIDSSTDIALIHVACEFDSECPTTSVNIQNNRFINNSTESMDRKKRNVLRNRRQSDPDLDPFYGIDKAILVDSISNFVIENNTQVDPLSLSNIFVIYTPFVTSTYTVDGQIKNNTAHSSSSFSPTIRVTNILGLAQIDGVIDIQNNANYIYDYEESIRTIGTEVVATPEPSTIAASTTEAPTIEASTAAATTAEIRTTETATTEASTTETAITETATTEASTTEASTTETAITEASTTEASTTEASTTETATTEASTTEASTTKASTTETATTEASTTETSTTEASTTSTTEASTTEASTTETSTTEASTTETSTTEASTTETATTKTATTKTATSTSPQTSTATSQASINTAAPTQYEPACGQEPTNANPLEDFPFPPCAQLNVDDEIPRCANFVANVAATASHFTRFARAFAVTDESQLRCLLNETIEGGQVIVIKNDITLALSNSLTPKGIVAIVGDIHDKPTISSTVTDSVVSLCKSSLDSSECSSNESQVGFYSHGIKWRNTSVSDQNDAFIQKENTYDGPIRITYSQFEHKRGENNLVTAKTYLQLTNLKQDVFLKDNAFDSDEVLNAVIAVDCQEDFAGGSFDVNHCKNQAKLTVKNNIWSTGNGDSAHSQPESVSTTAIRLTNVPTALIENNTAEGPNAATSMEFNFTEYPFDDGDNGSVTPDYNLNYFILNNSAAGAASCSARTLSFKASTTGAEPVMVPIAGNLNIQNNSCYKILKEVGFSKDNPCLSVNSARNECPNEIESCSPLATVPPSSGFTNLNSTTERDETVSSVFSNYVCPTIEPTTSNPLYNRLTTDEWVGVGVSIIAVVFVPTVYAISAITLASFAACGSQDAKMALLYLTCKLSGSCGRLNPYSEDTSPSPTSLEMGQQKGSTN